MAQSGAGWIQYPPPPFPPSLPEIRPMGKKIVVESACKLLFHAPSFFFLVSIRACYTCLEWHSKTLLLIK